MRACIQRVSRAAVTIGDERVGEIGPGIVVLLGVGVDDTRDDAEQLAEKITHLRIFEDDDGKMNRSLLESEGNALVVSQFTLFGDCRKGRRPSFVAAAPPELAELRYQQFTDALQRNGVPVQTGRFRAMMQVELVNDGPVTFLIDTQRREWQ